MIICVLCEKPAIGRAHAMPVCYNHAPCDGTLDERFNTPPLAPAVPRAGDDETDMVFETREPSPAEKRLGEIADHLQSVLFDDPAIEKTPYLSAAFSEISHALLVEIPTLIEAQSSSTPTPPGKAPAGLPAWVIARLTECRLTISERPAGVGVCGTNSDVIVYLTAELAQVQRERDEAIAHDRQPYPTAWAYEQACTRIGAMRPVVDAALAWESACNLDVPVERQMAAATALRHALQSYRATRPTPDQPSTGEAER